MTDTQQDIHQRLSLAFSPITLEIEDQSRSHRGHEGAKQHGGGHYAVTIVSAAFEGKSPVERHRMVYQALGELMQGDIHALQIKASAP